MKIYTENEKTHAEYLYRLDGAKAVAEHFGIALSTVYLKLKQWGIKTDRDYSTYRIKSGDPRMTNLLAYIKTYWKNMGYSPSVQDIMEDLSISSTSVVLYRLDLLESHGQIKRTKNVSRSIVIIEETEYE